MVMEILHIPLPHLRFIQPSARDLLPSPEELPPFCGRTLASLPISTHLITTSLQTRYYRFGLCSFTNQSVLGL